MYKKIYRSTKNVWCLYLKKKNGFNPLKKIKTNTISLVIKSITYWQYFFRLKKPVMNS